MPAERTKKHHHGKHGKHARPTGPDGTVRHKVPPLQQRDGLMGVSKLKAAIRQTKRMLAKENIEPGLRVATQRRLTSLEADLAAAEQRNLEKKNGQKYHAIKFFERQKLGRIIKRLSRELEAMAEGATEEGDEAEGGEEEEGKKKKKEKKSKKGDDKDDKDDKKREKQQKKDKKRRAALEKQLLHARVMFNYTLHFPNAQKYIALFAEQTKESRDAETNDTSIVVPLPTFMDDAPETLEGPARTRREILAQMEKLMAEGALAAEPEKEPRDARRRPVAIAVPGVAPKANAKEAAKEGKEEAAEEAKGDEEEDDFFDDDE